MQAQGADGPGSDDIVGVVNGADEDRDLRGAGGSDEVAQHSAAWRRGPTLAFPRAPSRSGIASGPIRPRAMAPRVRCQ